MGDEFLPRLIPDGVLRDAERGGGWRRIISCASLDAAVKRR